MKHILVPIGSTENASNTLQYAIDFAGKFDAKIFVFRAYNFQTKAGTIINIDSIIERETNLYMRSVVNSVDRKNIDVKLISAKGSVLDTIETIDNELGIDLIIVGPKSNSIKEEVFLGRTTCSPFFNGLHKIFINSQSKGFLFLHAMVAFLQMKQWFQ